MLPLSAYTRVNFVLVFNVFDTVLRSSSLRGSNYKVNIIKAMQMRDWNTLRAEGSEYLRERSD